MKIPKQLKIGGRTYNVFKTTNLDLGNANYSGEIDYINLNIKICPAPKEKEEAVFIHEMIHGIFDFLGYTDHDEKKVDELANALHMVIKDNPKIFNQKQKSL